MSTTPSITANVILVGPAKAGKSTLLRVYHGRPYSKVYEMTEGIEVLNSPVKVNGATVQLMIFDAGGDPIYSELKKPVAPQAAAVVACFDVTSSESLRGAIAHAQEALRLIAGAGAGAAARGSGAPGSKPFGVLVGCKHDLRDLAEVSEADAQEAAQSLGFDIFYASAQDGQGVEAPFAALAGAIKRRYDASAAAVVALLG